MPLEIRILTGARAGQVDKFEKPVIVVGRHATVDLRFSPEKDLDVSGRHAEIRKTDAGYTLHDTGSTNGTFLNGEKIEGGAELHDGDKVLFGAKGPEVEIRTERQSAAAAVRPRKSSTEERVAVAVRNQTSGLKRLMVAGIVIVALGVGVAYFIGRRESAKQVEELRLALAANDAHIVQLQSGLRGDTSLASEAERQIKALRDRLPGATTDAERDSLRAGIAAVEKKLSSMIQMDLPTINANSAPAVALLVSEIGGKAFAGSGFAITHDGLLITNRHNVVNEQGERASRLAVKFRDSGEWLPAQIVKIANDDEGDLALIQVTAPGKTFPIVNGVQAGSGGSVEGTPVAIIGFPLGYDIAMEGEGNNFIAKTTLNSGTISKRTSSILQIDSFAAHGSSGSPVLNARGNVVGVVYGGPGEAGGRIVYAVPQELVAAFVPAEYRGIVKE